MTRSRASVEDAAYEQSNAEELGPGNIMPVARECSIASPTDGNTAAGAFGDAAPAASPEMARLEACFFLL